MGVDIYLKSLYVGISEEKIPIIRVKAAYQLAKACKSIREALCLLARIVFNCNLFCFLLLCFYGHTHKKTALILHESRCEYMKEYLFFLYDHTLRWFQVLVAIIDFFHHVSCQCLECLSCY